MITVGLAAMKTKRIDKTVKIDAELLRLALVVSAYKDVHLNEYLSQALLPVVRLDLEVDARASVAGSLVSGVVSTGGLSKTAKLDAEVVRLAVSVAALRSLNLKEYLSVALGPVVRSDLEAEHAKYVKAARSAKL